MKGTRLRLTSAAKRDVAKAAFYYSDQVAGLGEDFIQEIQLTMARILANPLQFRIYYHPESLRRAVVTRFPYCIFYIADPSEILVIAVQHGSRNENIWKRRL